MVRGQASSNSLYVGVNTHHLVDGLTPFIAFLGGYWGQSRTETNRKMVFGLGHQGLAENVSSEGYRFETLRSNGRGGLFLRRYVDLSMEQLIYTLCNSNLSRTYRIHDIVKRTARIYKSLTHLHLEK
jgi:hypothetical protein